MWPSAGGKPFASENNEGLRIYQPYLAATRVLYSGGKNVIDFFDFCTEMLCVANKEGYFLELNPAWRRTLGWTLKELSSRPYIEFVHPDDVENTLQEASLLQGDDYETVHFRNRYRCKDGSYKWLEWQAKRKPGTDTIVATARDITDRIRSEQNSRAIFEQAPVGIALTDSRTGQFRHVNPRLGTILGRSSEELLKLTFQAITHPEDLQQGVDAMKLLLKGEIRQFKMGKRYLRPDGSIVWTNLTVVPLCEAGKKPTSNLAIVEDVTEMKKAEERLQTRETQLEALLENSSNVVYMKDSEGRYVLVNRRHRELFHKTEAEIYGKTDPEIFPEENATAFIASDAKVWEVQEPLIFEEVAPHDDGPHTYRSVKFPVKDKQGRMIALGGISTDITDLTNAYEDLEEKERLLRGLIEVQEQEKQFICYEFHDGLIQYVVGAKMALESCLQKQQSNPDATVITDVVNNLQKGIEEGRRVIRGIRPTVLDDMGVEAAIEDLIDQMSTSGLAIELDRDQSLGRYSKPLEATLYRVVQEALTNARKHSRTEKVRVAICQQDGHLQTTIQDDGCGFNVEEKGHQGFGLLGMNERVRLMGGDLDIQSRPGVGTTISIRLPIGNRDKGVEQ